MSRAAEWWRVLLARSRALVSSERVHDEIGEELQFHIDMRTRDLMRGGIPEAEARRAATLAFGSVPGIKEVSYDIRGGGAVEALRHDLGYALRSLRKQPVLSAVVVGVVAIGIASASAILGVADRVLWRPLPVHAPGELEQFTLTGGLNDRSKGTQRFLTAMSYPLYQAFREDSGAFAGIVARSRQTSTFGSGGDAERRVVELVSGNYFSVLGIAPADGRLLSADDDASLMSHPVVVLSQRYWREHYRGSASAIGRTLLIDDYPLTIVGVAPAGFFGVEVGVEPDAWVPLAMHPVLFAAHQSLVNDGWMWLDVLGRRAPGWTTTASAARATVTLRHFQEASGEPVTKATPRAVALLTAARGLSRLREPMAVPLAVLIGIVAFVLVVACANLATLIVVRSTARTKEMGVRLALGASRWRIVRQLLLESLLLAGAGGIVGALLAVGATRALAALLLPGGVLNEIDVTPDARLLAISLLLSTLTGVVFGIAPALRAARLDIATVIRDVVPRNVAHRWHLGRRALVALQTGVSLVLVIAAGLFARSLQRLAAAPSGFDAGHVLMATINPTQNRYTRESALSFFHTLETRLATMPGVRAAGTSSVALLGGPDEYNIITLRVPGRKWPTDPFSLLTQSIGADFFGATGVRIVRGRALDAHDVGKGPVSIVLNEAAAHAYFGDIDPIGQTVKLMGQPAIVVGLARDSKYRTMREEMPQTLYLTFDQDAFIGDMERTVYVRTAGDPLEFASRLAAVVHDIDRALPVYDIRTLAGQQRASMASERVVAGLSGLAAAIALLLAAIGLYGLVAFDAQRRTREIGVRIACGATPSRIVTLVLRGALTLVVAGTIGGLLLTRGLGRLVAAQLYGISASDVSVALAACVALLATAFVAASIPAWRASRVNPVEALRSE